MDFLSDLEQRIAAVSAFAALDVAAAARRSDDDIVRLIEAGSALVRVGERLRAVAAGVAATRSVRESGHAGLAQARGHRDAVSLVQQLSGSTRSDAAKQVRLGESLLEASMEIGRVEAGPGAMEESPRGLPWHAVVDAAVLAGGVTVAQADAILRGLGDPPADPGDVAPGRQAVEAWGIAAQQLLDEVPVRTVEELAAAGRQIRDRLDAEGAEARYLARHEARSFRMWTDADGIHHAKLRFDDHGAAWVRSMLDSALRPRRGGPRFVDPEEAATAGDLIADPRSNDQLAYDLIIDVLRAGRSPTHRRSSARGSPACAWSS
ncbi:hypothetical protein [Microbacterium marinilacus]|uniref:DUF222 domain-containing protein n=1 Tax=Microbacterium marinilacus TaxID=415209 RepID=A0ABP7BBZ8_9MICO|nr:hypothetical protein [Microbacterium marinilacus]MBY0689423.1 hypothetical protein [Microbacterium marinilacus]